MNKKGQHVFLGIMVAIVVFIALMQLIDPLKEVIEDVRGSTKLDCGSDTNSVGVQSTCVLVDMWLFYFIGAGIAVSVGSITTFATRKT